MDKTKLNELYSNVNNSLKEYKMAIDTVSEIKHLIRLLQSGNLSEVAFGEGTLSIVGSINPFMPDYTLTTTNRLVGHIEVTQCLQFDDKSLDISYLVKNKQYHKGLRNSLKRFLSVLHGHQFLLKGDY